MANFLAKPLVDTRALCEYTRMNAWQALAEHLRAKQQSLDDTDLAFSERLGVDRETWRKFRIREIVKSPGIMQGALAAFPEMAEGIMALFAPPIANIHTNSGNLDTERAS